MCSCDMADPPSCFTRTTRRAAKAHHCCECHRTIGKGDRYEYVSGVWDGYPSSLRTCARCVMLREALPRADWSGGELT